MCDYSLEFVASRPAKIGDKLVSTKFGESVTRGFAAVGVESNIAVCLLPGTEIAFEQEVEYRHSLLPNQKTAQKVARFRRVNMDKAKMHHAEGQFATVLQLPAAPRVAKETDERQHVLVVA